MYHVVVCVWVEQVDVWGVSCALVLKHQSAQAVCCCREAIYR